MNLKIVEAEKGDREFILRANREIDQVSGIAKSALQSNIESDVIHNKKGVCLIAKSGRERVGMVLFSKVYWADRGEGVYVSQAFVEEKYRHKGVFKALISAVFDFFPEANFVTLLVAKGNIPMQKCVSKLGFEWEDMLSFVVNKTDFQ